MNQDIYHPIEEAISSSHDIDIPIAHCLFCQMEVNNPQRIPTIEKTILLCNNCHNILLDNYSEIDQNTQCNLNYDPIFSQATVISEQRFIPYGIQKGQCGICYDDNIFLHKFGECKHYFCFTCLLELVKNNQIVNCPFQGCQNIMHDYLKLQLAYFPSKLVKPYMVCHKRQCRVKLSVEPFQNMKPISVIIQGDKVHCSECNTTFCSKCWHKHKGSCPFDSLFLESFSKFNIVRCPNCSVLGSAQLCEEDDIDDLFLFNEFQVNAQQCPLCQHSFCYTCKRELQYYESISNNKFLTCKSCKVKHYNFFGRMKQCCGKSALKIVFGSLSFIALLFIGLLVAITFLAGVILYFTINQFTKCVKIVIKCLNPLNQLLPRKVLIISSIIWAPIVILVIVIVFTVSFLPLMIGNLYKIVIEENKCSFCDAQDPENRQVLTLQESLTLCPQCYGEISEHYFGEQTLEFKNKIQIYIKGQFLPYSLRRGVCDECENLQILWKLNKCNHHLCTDCCVQLAMVTYSSTKCPIDDCNIIIDDYFIVQFIEQEYIQYLIKPKMMCYNTKCRLSFQVEPYGFLHSDTIYINNEQTVHCNECKITFCGYCWRKHRGHCNFEKQFQDYKLKARLINCPNCKVICEPQRCNEIDSIFTYSIIIDRPFKVQNQQCQLCNYHFCLQCSAPLQLFEHNETIDWTCFPCKQYHRSYFGLISILCNIIPSKLRLALIIIIITAILFFLNLFTIIIIIIVFIVIQFMKISETTFELAEKLISPCPKLIRIVTYPFLILISFIVSVVIYTVSFIPLMIYNIYRMYK